MSNLTHCLPSNPDISGIGVRTAVYAQNLLSFIPAIFALQDKKVTPLELDALETQSTTILITAFAILLSVIVQALKGGLTNFHAAIILNLSWMNNTNLFIYFLLYAFHHVTEAPEEEMNLAGKRWPGLLRSFWTGRGQTKQAWKNPVFIIGTIHLSLMAAVGIWLWKRPVDFGNSQTCTLSASLVVVGQTVPIGSSALREWSLLIYSLLLTPVLNMIVPIGFFGIPFWVYSRFAGSSSLNRDAGINITRAGLTVLAVINILLLADTEVAISKNQALTAEGDKEWTFGQTLALLLLLVPIRDITESLLERRARSLGDQLIAAAEKEEEDSVKRAVKSGAHGTAIGPAISISLNHGRWDIAEYLVGHINGVKDACELLEGALQSGELTIRPEELYSAAEAGQVNTLKLLAKLNKTINVANEDGLTVFHIAAKSGNLDVVKVLVEVNADMNARDTKRWTPLQHAASAGHTDIVRFLRGINADMGAIDKDGLTALEIAARQGKIEVVKLLAEPGIDVNGRGWFVWAALRYAAESGNIEVSNCLTGLEPEMKERDFNYRATLHDVVERGLLEAAKIMVEVTRDIDVTDDHGQNALHLAVKNDHSELIELLVEHNADVNAKDKWGQTALHLAVKNGNSEVIKLLAERKANLHAKNKDGWTVPIYAAHNGHLEVIKLLAELKADVKSAKDNTGRTALHWAAHNGYLEVVKLLAELEVDVRAGDGNGQTALHIAASEGYPEVVKLLAELKVDVDAKNRNGETALHIAASEGYPEVIKLLAELKADVHAKSRAGWTGLHYAASKGRLEEIRLLAELRVDVHAKDRSDWTALHLAAYKGYLEEVKCLTELKADLHAKEYNDGKTALHIAAINGHFEIVKHLIELGADPNVRSKSGKAALQYAIREKKTDVVDFLSGLQVATNEHEQENSHTR